MPAGKRTRVPASLHSELTEYSSLLRALRTSNTLDLSSQLTAHASTVSANLADADDDDVEPIEVDEDGETERLPTESVAPSRISDQRTEASGATSSRRATSQATTRSTRTRDTWTRWPLLVGDVHIPEWSLEDEVKSIALRTLDAGHVEEHPDQDNLSVDRLSDLEDTAESQLTPHALNAITESTGRYLAQILALLAAYVPPREKSMQNRVRPLNWESVLTIAVANGLLTPDSFESLRRRLSAIYPQSPEVALHSYPKPTERHAEDMSFLSIEGYDPSLPLPRLDADTAKLKRRARSQGSGATAKRPKR